MRTWSSDRLGFRVGVVVLGIRCTWPGAVHEIGEAGEGEDASDLKLFLPLAPSCTGISLRRSPVSLMTCLVS